VDDRPVRRGTRPYRTAVHHGHRPHEQRLATAVAAVDELLADGWHFADPLPTRGGDAPVPELR
jgi:hypothetical protein